MITPVSTIMSCQYNTAENLRCFAMVFVSDNFNTCLVVHHMLFFFFCLVSMFAFLKFVHWFYCWDRANGEFNKIILFCYFIFETKKNKLLNTFACLASRNYFASKKIIAAKDNGRKDYSNFKCFERRK